MATVSNAWCYRVSNGTGWPGVSVPWLGEIAISILVGQYYIALSQHVRPWYTLAEMWTNHETACFANHHGYLILAIWWQTFMWVTCDKLAGQCYGCFQMSLYLAVLLLHFIHMYVCESILNVCTPVLFSCSGGFVSWLTEGVIFASQCLCVCLLTCPVVHTWCVSVAGQVCAFFFCSVRWLWAPVQTSRVSLQTCRRWKAFGAEVGNS